MSRPQHTGAGLFSAHGLVVSTPLPVPACVRVDEGDPDVVMVDGGVSRVPDESPDGEVLAEFWSGGANRCWLTDRGDEYVLRVPGIVDFVISKDLGHIVFRREVSVDIELVSIMTLGFVSAVLVSLMGDLALHASAVELDGRIVLIAAPTGHGKSTTASLLASAGAKAFADDVVRVSWGDGPLVHRGVAEYRLRPSAEWIASSTAGASSRTTTDGRRAIEPAASLLTVGPPDLLVFPRPDQGVERVQIHEVSPQAVFAHLHRCLRLQGWSDNSIRACEFVLLADLASALESVVAQIPWGTKGDDVGPGLRSALETRLNQSGPMVGEPSASSSSD